MTSKCMFQNFLLSRTEIQGKTAMNSKNDEEDPKLWINYIWENGCNKHIDGFWSLNNMKTNQILKK